MSVWFDSYFKSPLLESVLRLIPQNDMFKSWKKKQHQKNKKIENLLR